MNKHKEQIFKTDIGINAQVKRDSEQSELAGTAADVLRNIGEFLNPNKPVLEYLGSASVHIYQAPALKQLFFLTQTSTLDNTQEIIAGPAMKQLKQDMQVHYGHKRQTVRSGF